MNHHKRITSIFVALILLVALFSSLVWVDHNREKAIQKERDMQVLMVLKTQLETSLVSRLRLSEGINAFIAMTKTTDRAIIDPFLDILIKPGDTVFRNIALLKDTTIRYQYPLKGNEKTIGLDLTTIPEQKATILEAMVTLASTLNGPVELVQGGKGMVLRVPIVTKENGTERFWGSTSLVLDYDELFKEMMANKEFDDYHLTISKLNSTGQVESQIYANADVSSDASFFDMPVLQQTWRLSVEQKDAQKIAISTLIFALVALIISIGVAWLLDKWLSQKETLNEDVLFTTQKLRDTNEILEQYVAEFEEKQAELELLNNQLEDSLENLRTTQEQLILTEKLAALGDLVSSLAHEINTPLGVCVTLYSFIEENLEAFKRHHLDGTDKLTREILDRLVDDNTEALKLMGHNLKRSSELVSSFKLVSMDQYLEEYRIINIAHYLDEIINSIRPKYKKIDSLLTLTVDPEIRLYTYPGAISQIMTNLINNSVVHGFDGKQEGKIMVVVEKGQPGYVRISYQDSGIGLTEESREKLFTPFFTTKKHKGSSGLGMHIVYNAVVKTLGGAIEVMNLKKGFGVVIEIPIQVANKASDNDSVRQ